MEELVQTNNTPKRKKHLKRSTSQRIFVIGLLALPIIQFVVFWIVPNFNSILLAFKDDSGFSFTYFQDFFRTLTDPEASDHLHLICSIRNSLIYFAVNIFICTPLVIFFSYVLFRKVPLHGAFKVIFYLPSIIGMTVTATLFLFVFQKGAPVYELLKSWGWIPAQADRWGGLFSYEGTAFLMVVIYSVWTCVGLNMIMFHGAMKRIPQEIFESADMDGAGFFRQFLSLVVPLIWPTITTLIIFSISGIFVTYGAVMILAPQEKTAFMIGYYILEKTTSEQYNTAAAIGLAFTCVGLPFVLIVKKALDKIGANVEY